MVSPLLIRKHALILIIITLYFATIHATRFEVQKCHFTVWAASIPGGGKKLLPGQTWSSDVNRGTFPAQIWGEAGRGKCLTGDCGGHLKYAKILINPHTPWLNITMA
ncbi:unnamed protein product [Prunus armeniaca]|uniref:Uncharacterized protein n=1 Tax=Prunus armeniaca TaxID=36596 RepID=A0A6J5UMW3_PRUAR|nr:unnamed protein product [Prunus armeniaca]